MKIALPRNICHAIPRAVSITALAMIAPNSLATPTLLINEITTMASGQWTKLNTNPISSIWPATANIPKYDGQEVSPYSVITAWSSFAWDPVRSDLILFGGGNRNYAGNEVYKFNGSTLTWGLASLPSEAVPGAPQVSTSTAGSDPAYQFTPSIPNGGALSAPQSTHTYDNAVWLPNAQRYMIFGGAATGGQGENFMKDNGNGTYSLTGPYLFDPTKADGTKVGGADCTNVTSAGQACAVGGNMWQNRDSTFATSRSFVSGTSDVVSRDGKDVVYVTARTGSNTSPELFEYVITDVNNPALDTWRKIGNYDSSGGTAAEYVIGHAFDGAGAYDPIRNIYIRTGTSNLSAFEFWSVDSASSSNPIRRATVNLPPGFVMSTNFGIDYDPINDQFLIWDGHMQVWALKIPADPSQTWQLTQDSTLDPNGAPNAIYTDGNGILGKWHFLPELNAFIGLENASEGNVWLYKPSDWVSPFAAVGDVPLPAASLSLMLGLLLLSGARGQRKKSNRKPTQRR